MARPKITPDRINKDAAKKYPLTNGNDLETGKRIGYIAGATAENELAHEELKDAQDAAAMFCNKYNVVATQLADIVDEAQKLANALEILLNKMPKGDSLRYFHAKEDVIKGRETLQQWNAGKETKFEGSVISEPAPGISLGCISPEARDLLDTIMEQWEKHYRSMKEMHGDAMPETTFYGFAYWLVRWSGLIRPMPKNESMPDGCPYCGSPECTSDHK